MRGLRLLQKHGVEYNVLTTVNGVNADYPLEVYRFLRDDAGAAWMQFIPVVERIDADGLTLLQEGRGFPNARWGRISSAASCAPSSTSGCCAMWAASSSRRSRRRFATGSA